MFEIRDKPKMVERALLIGAYFDRREQAEAQSLLDELAELATTLGIPIAESQLVFVKDSNKRFLTGSGKVKELIARAKELECDVIIFDNQLSPAQQRNWEELAKITVIDRQEIILDIFGSRAQTREAKTQGGTGCGGGHGRNLVVIASCLLAVSPRRCNATAARL